MKLIRRLKNLLFAPKTVRLEVRFVTWTEAEKLLGDPAWQVAPEEDRNRQMGWVWLERVVAP